MKILGTILARAVWVLDMQQLNPNGRSLLDLYQGIAKHYRFSKFPQHLLDFNAEKALEFNSGTFIKSPNEDRRVGLTIYNNAIVADGLHSTDDSEAFLHDVAKFAAKEHNLVFDLNSIVRTSYSSQLDVQFDSEPPLVNPKLKFLPSRLKSLASSYDGNPMNFGFGGLPVWYSGGVNDGGILSFKLEHKWNIPFEKNIYFSSAPTTTKDHLTILNEIDTALK